MFSSWYRHFSFPIVLTRSQVFWGLVSGISRHVIVRESTLGDSIGRTPSLDLANVQVTEAPSYELVKNRLDRRDVAPCTQWTVIGAAGLGCSVGTCVFGTRNGVGYEQCGTPQPTATFVTSCYDYPQLWEGLSPVDVFYCSATQPYCGVFQFIINDNTYTNWGCSTVPYNLEVVTVAGATFSSVSPAAPTIPAAASSTVPIQASPTPTPPSVAVPTSTTPIPMIVAASSSSTLSSSAATSFTTPAPAVESTQDSPPSMPISSTSSLSPPNVTPCSDPTWDPNPANWYDANVDQELTSWWTSTADKRGSTAFVDWLSQSFGDMSRGQQCGIGAEETCSAPDCAAFQNAGGPRWVYFVRISIVNMNSLFNLMEAGMQDAETDLSLVMSDMAVNFFPWKDPRTDLNKALPWIQSIVTGVLGFIPIIGEALTKSAGFKTWGQGVVNVAQSITSGGFQAIGQNEANPVDHQLGTIQELGTLIKQVVSSMRDGLGSWSTTLFDGQEDKSGKTIIDYMAFGRFTLSYGLSEAFLDAAYFQVQVSKLVDGQWQDKKNAPSQTFVMCTNSTDSCTDASKYTEGGRSCCLYSVNGKADYVSPPALAILGNSTYNITPSDITASSLHTYMSGGLNYDDTTINDKIEQTISLNNNETFLSQGVQFQGVWTLPVCDVGQNGDWVADYTDDMMPCCCGINCVETETFWENVGIANNGAAKSKCKSQCPDCAIVSTASSSRFILGLEVRTGAGLLLLIYGIFFCLM